MGALTACGWRRSGSAVSSAAAALVAATAATPLCPNHTSTLSTGPMKAMLCRGRGQHCRTHSSDDVAVPWHWPPPSSGSGTRWRDSSLGVHSWLVFDSKVTPAEALAAAPRHDFVWGSSTPDRARAWRQGNPQIVVSRYINGNRDSTNHSGNLTWFEENHPDWIMYTCPNSTGQRSVAWIEHDVDVPIDWGNPDVVSYQLERFSGPAFAATGYNAVAVDGYHFANLGRACGHYGKNGTFVTQYRTDGPGDGRWDPGYTRDAKLWLSRFWMGLQATPAPVRPLLILNFDLSLCRLGGCRWDDPDVLFVGNHSDGTIDEGAYTWSADAALVRANDQPAWLWRDTLLWASNLQRNGKAYYPIVESLNCTAPQQSAIKEDDTTLSTPYWTWYLASYLLAKGNASALYVSPVFADAPVDRQHTVTMTYGQLPWYLGRFQQASAVGKAAGPMQWPTNTTATRVFTGGFVAANVGADVATFAVPGAHTTYFDIRTNATVAAGSKLRVPGRNASILIAV